MAAALLLSAFFTASSQLIGPFPQPAVIGFAAQYAVSVTPAAHARQEAVIAVQQTSWAEAVVRKKSAIEITWSFLFMMFV